jgi:cytochrome c1
VTRTVVILSALAGVIALAAIGAGLWVRERGEQRDAVERARALTGGEPLRAATAIGRLGCGSCHDIPGVPGARGQVGPPLAHMGARVYIAGVMPNTPENMILWIRWPQGVLPKSVMPNMGASEAESRDIAAYLFSLQ